MLRVQDIERLTGARRSGGDREAELSHFTIDSRQARPGSLFVGLPGTRADGATYARDAVDRGALAVLTRLDSAPCSVASDRVAELQVEDPVTALAELAHQLRDSLRARVVAITGSSGKTTTKELAHWILSWSCQGRAAPASFNNALGVPLTILGATAADEDPITEVGTNSPGEIDKLASIVRPDHGVITCVGPTHLEGLGSLDQVAAEKAALLDWIRPGGVAVLNAGDPRVNAMRVPESLRVVRFAVETDGVEPVEADVRGRVVEVGMGGLVLEVRGLEGVDLLHVPLLGRHNAQNILAALVTARLVDPGCIICEDWLSFRSPPMRMEIIAREGATFLNDAYNANPQSMRAALSTLAELPASERIAVLGEMRELGVEAESHHREVGRAAATLPLAAIVTVGRGARGIASGAREAGFDPARIRETVDLVQARVALAELVEGEAGEGKLVLLKASRAAGLEKLLG